MILTVTLNPAVDKTVILDEMILGNVNRIKEVREDAGGKGINVSKMVCNLGGNTLATGVIGGLTGRFILDQLETLDVPCDFVEAPGKTRTNVKIIDKKNNQYTDMNEPGMELSPAVLETLENKMFEQINEDGVLVLSGSVPQNVEKNIYKKWIARAKKIGVKTILDADGPLLQKGIEEGPYLIKPNIDELERLFDTKLTEIEDIVEHAKQLIDQGVQIVVVSMGEKGCLFVTEKITYVSKALSVEVKSTVGAGDSMVAALAYALEQKYSLEEAIPLAVAAATASISNDGTQMGTREQVDYWKDSVEFVEYKTK